MALGLGVESAFADAPTPVPVSPDEVVALDEGGEYVPEDPTVSPCGGGALGALNSVAPTPDCTSSNLCDVGWRYGIYLNLTNDLRVFDRWFVTNGTGSTVLATFKAETGGTVTATAGITLTAEASALVFAKVSASVNASISRSVTASTGVSVTSSVKPHSTLKGDYGIWREKVRMKRYYVYSNCTHTTIQYFDYIAPYRKGWRLYY